MIQELKHSLREPNTVALLINDHTGKLQRDITGEIEFLIESYEALLYERAKLFEKIYRLEAQIIEFRFQDSKKEE